MSNPNVSELRNAKGTPIMVISNDEMIDLTRSHSLEEVLQVAGREALAITLEHTGENGSTTTEISQQLRRTDEDRKQLIKISWIVLEVGQELRYSVIYWNLDPLTIYDIGNWIYSKRDGKREPKRRIRPRLKESVYLEDLSKLSLLQGDTKAPYQIYEPRES